jgi:hypothetical protein
MNVVHTFGIFEYLDVVPVASNQKTVPKVATSRILVDFNVQLLYTEIL